MKKLEGLNKRRWLAPQVFLHMWEVIRCHLFDDDQRLLIQCAKVLPEAALLYLLVIIYIFPSWSVNELTLFAHWQMTLFFFLHIDPKFRTMKPNMLLLCVKPQCWTASQEPVWHRAILFAIIRFAHSQGVRTLVSKNKVWEQAKTRSLRTVK